MEIELQDQALLLLTCWLPKRGSDDPRPLSPTEWGRFAAWLNQQGITPEALLEGGIGALLKGWQDKEVTLDRLQRLLGRGAALGIALEGWYRAGLWLLTRANPAYPTRLKRRLKSLAPPVLFGCGDAALLERGGLAIVGSRDADAQDLAFTRWLGGESARQGYPVLSGGARGVDSTAMQGALEEGGPVVGVLAERLLRAATSTDYRAALMEGQMVLISPFHPEARFEVGNAMARNKYIYCLSEGAVVVTTAKGKGGTWSGAVENLKHGWVPLWLYADSASATAGREALLDRGARLLPSAPRAIPTLFKAPAIPVQPALATAPPPGEAAKELPPAPPHEAAPRTGRDAVIPWETWRFYDLFLYRLGQLTTHEALTTEALQPHFDVSAAQLKEWLKSATSEGRVEKLARPVRYRWRGERPAQPPLFTGD